MTDSRTLRGILNPAWAPTRQQVRILDFIREYRLNSPERRSPSFTEIANACGIKSRGHISKVINQLADHKALSFVPGHPRSIVVAATHAITIDFPDDIWAELLLYARRGTVSPDAIVIAAVHDALPSLRSRFARVA